MDFLDSVFAALDAGADRIIEAAVPLIIGYAAWALRRTLLSGLPALLHTFVASAIERYLMPIAENGVRYAEEWAQRQIDRGLAAAGTLGRQKADAAKRYILARMWTDRFISDERLSEIIDAALVKIGRGAAGGIELGVEYVESKLGEVPPPPAA